MALKYARIAIAALSFSAAGLVGTVVHENYTSNAVIPVKGDVPTYGFGMTHRPDGTPVQMGDTTTPPKALRQSLDHIQKDEKAVKACVTADLHQGEYDLMVDFSYQYGAQTLCNSSQAAHANLGNYFGSCYAYLQYRFVGKGKDRYDCSTMIDGQRNKRCWGVWQRSLDRFTSCMAMQ